VVKVFGEDIPTLNRLARDIAARIREAPGSIFALRNAGIRYLWPRSLAARPGGSA
jgi:Cu/Ag efflux pump CusA